MAPLGVYPTVLPVKEEESCPDLEVVTDNNAQMGHTPSSPSATTGARI